MLPIVFDLLLRQTIVREAVNFSVESMRPTLFQENSAEHPVIL
jgi:hypothetical protein